jgi:radical SAM protein with 4Fe4S-binding SPASM domain
MFENVYEIILKVTRDCNLRCAYCYVRDKDRFRGERMSFAVFKAFIERYIQDRAKNVQQPNRSLLLTFHGGEPTLLGAPELMRFMNYAKKRIPDISFAMQTNLTNVSAELAMVLKKYKISPGISVDGWRSRANSLRMGKRKSPVLKNVKKLRQYQVNCGPLLVVNKINIKNIFTDLTRLVKYFSIPAIKANYVENIYSPDFVYPECTAEELLRELFIPALKNFLKTGRLVERNVSAILDSFFNKLLFETENTPLGDCITDNCLAKFCTGGNGLAEVDANGLVCSCGRWDDAHELCQLGSIYDKDLWGINSYHKTLSLQVQKARAIRQRRCDNCPAGDICHYGCLAFSYAKYRDIRIREDAVCAYFCQIKKYLQKNAANILEIYALRVRKWRVRWQGQDFLQVFLPEHAPKLNSARIAEIGWLSGSDGRERYIHARR